MRTNYTKNKNNLKMKIENFSFFKLFKLVPVFVGMAIFASPAHAAVPTFTMDIQALTGGNDKILIRFSEGVSGTSGGSTAIDAADFTVGGTDGLTITGVSHTAGNDYAVLTMSATLNIGGAGEVTIACAATAIYDDNATNACVQGATDVNGASADTTAPTVTDGNISIAGGSGTGGAYIIGDTVTVTWDNSGSGDNNAEEDFASATANLTGFGGGASAAMTDTTACSGVAGDNIYEACYTITAGAIDGTNVNASVTAQDHVENSSGAIADTTNATVDNQAPSITDNGTLTITTDNGVASTAAVNGNGTLADRVTQTNATVSSADGDTTTIDLTNLTGQASVAGGVESGDVTAGSLDSGSQTFTITVTDNAGNTDTTTSDAISVDNQIPNITDNGTLTISTDNGVASTAAVNGNGTLADRITQSTVTLTLSDGDTETTDFTNLTGQASVANGVETTDVTSGSLDNGSQTFTITVTDNGGNVVTTATDAISVDNQIPNITDNGTLTISTDNGVASTAAVNGGGTAADRVTQSTVTLSVADSDTQTTDFTTLTGQASVANGVETTDVTAGSLDNASQTFTITVTDNGGNVATTATDAISVDNEAPNVTDNGTLTISTDNGVASTAAVNGGGTAADRVTQSTVTISSADGDTTTTDFTTLTGQASVAAGVETTDVTAGSLDNGSQTFTISVTDDGGNVTQTATDAISVDNEIPTITTPGVVAIVSDVNTNSTADIGDTVSYTDAAEGTGDSITTISVDFTGLTGTAAALSANNPHTVIAGALSGSTSFTESLTDNAGNVATGSTNAISVFNLTSGSIGSPSITLNNDVQDNFAAGTFSFTIASDLPADGKIEITFPSGYDVTLASSVLDTSYDGNSTVGVAGQVVTITRSNDGNPVTAPATVSFRLNTLKNPSTAGTTGTFTIRTLNGSNSELDANSAVSGVTITEVASTSLNDGTNTSGGGGGGGGGVSAPAKTSNTQTSRFSSRFENVVKRAKDYSRPIQLQNSIIDKSGETKKAQLTTDGGQITMRPNSQSTVAAIIPANTTVEGPEDWDGKINPPIVKSVNFISKLGEEIKGSDKKLNRSDVVIVIEVGSRDHTLSFDKKVKLELPAEDLNDNTGVTILISKDNNTWEVFGKGTVVDGKVTFETNEFSYFAVTASSDVGEISASSARFGAAPSRFRDTAGHWADSYVSRIAERGIVQGKTSDSFAPDDNITRAEVTKIALNSFGIEPNFEKAVKPFEDADLSEWYTPYLITAKDRGVVYEGEDNFRPNVPVTRKYALRILLEAAGVDTDAHYANKYAKNRDENGWTYAGLRDVGINSWFAKYVGYAVDNGIISGIDGDFRPDQLITRAEVAKIAVTIGDLIGGLADVMTDEPAATTEETDEVEEEEEETEEASDEELIEEIDSALDSDEEESEETDEETSDVDSILEDAENLSEEELDALYDELGDIDIVTE